MRRWVNLSSHIDLHTHAGSAFDNCVTLTFDLLTPESIYAVHCHTMYVYEV